MIGKRLSPAVVGMLLIFCFTVTGIGSIQNAHSALTAKTTLTVVNVDEFKEEEGKSPSEVINYDVTAYLHNVNYIPHLVTFNWEMVPPNTAWKTGSTALTARIWVIKPKNGGKSYYALAWDYIKNTTTAKHRGSSVPTSWLGTMISSLCDTNSTCNARERTNIVFWP